MGGLSLFEHVLKGPTDPMFDLKVELDSDASPAKVDLGAGVYRDINGAYYEFPIIIEARQTVSSSDVLGLMKLQAKRILEKLNPGHDVSLDKALVIELTLLDCL
jgi:aspartate aminotransferase